MKPLEERSIAIEVSGDEDTVLSERDAVLEEEEERGEQRGEQREESKERTRGVAFIRESDTTISSERCNVSYILSLLSTLFHLSCVSHSLCLSFCTCIDVSRVIGTFFLCCAMGSSPFIPERRGRETERERKREKEKKRKEEKEKEKEKESKDNRAEA